MIYLSGKIGDPDFKKMRQNLSRFLEVEEKLGVECINPAKLPQTRSYEYLLARCIIEIFELRPDMYFMRGWDESRGARLEHELAIQLGLKIDYEP